MYSPWLTHVIMRITTVACYVIQQNNCVCANQSSMCTCTHKIIYHCVFRVMLFVSASSACTLNVLGVEMNACFLFYRMICVVVCNV